MPSQETNIPQEATTKTMPPHKDRPYHVKITNIDAQACVEHLEQFPCHHKDTTRVKSIKFMEQQHCNACTTNVSTKGWDTCKLREILQSRKRQRLMPPESSRLPLNSDEQKTCLRDSSDDQNEAIIVGCVNRHNLNTRERYMNTMSNNPDFYKW